MRVSALFALLTLAGWLGSVPVRAAEPELVMRAPESVPALDGLIRAGLERYAHGDLDGADAAWRRLRVVLAEASGDRRFA